MRIAVAANFVAQGLVAPLKFWLSHLNISADLWIAPFDQIQQQLLEPYGDFVRSDFRIILIQTGRWVRGPRSEMDAPSFLSVFVNLVKEFVVRATSGPLLLVFAPSSLSGQQAASVQLAESGIRSALADVARLRIVTSAEVCALYPYDRDAEIHDWYLDKIAAAPFTDLGLATLATVVARNIYSHISHPKKVIALDCDNTLWSGNCGESNLSTLKVEAKHLLLQKYFVEQSRAGKLLCLCSKNDESSVLRVFDNHPQMILTRIHLAAWKINWNHKVGNLVELAMELGLSLDSFIFFDDDSFECAAVREVLPEILTIHIPGEADERGVQAILQSNWQLDSAWTRPTHEDQIRNSFYRRNSDRRALQNACVTFTEFLSALNLRVDLTVMTRENADRISQLTKRTNQFNLNGIHMSPSELLDSLEDAAIIQYVVEAADRFGDYGVVGFIRMTRLNSFLVINSFMLSCRALGRAIEKQMLLAVVAEAEGSEGAVDGLVFDFRVTGRNDQVAALLSRMGALKDQVSLPITIARLSEFLVRFEEDTFCNVDHSA